MENSGLIKKEDLLKELCSFCNSGYDGHCPHPYGTCNEYEIISQFKEIPEINKGKILRLIDEIDYVVSNVYDTGHCMQDCDYANIFQRLKEIKKEITNEKSD